MRDKHTGKSPVSPLMCDFSDTKSSLKMRLASIFDNSKKKKGIISLIIILIIIGLIGSFFVFGKKEVEQTNDSLTIHVIGTRNNTQVDPYDYEAVVADYQKKYPNVNVKIVEYADKSIDTHGDLTLRYNTYTEKMTAEILAGKGPDVIIFDETMMQIKDVNKIIAAGVIAPMDKFIKADMDFKQEDYYQGILKSGMYRGKRYALPIRFSFPLLFTGENTLKDSGINQSECNTDYVSLFKQYAEYVNANIDNPNAKMLLDSNITSSGLLNYMGGNPIKSNKNIDTPEFRSVVENMNNIKSFTKYYQSVSPPELIKSGKVIFSCASPPYCLNEYDGIGKLLLFDKPVIIPLKKTNGNIEAVITDCAMINANSSNQQNAYNFIKEIMSYKQNGYYHDFGLSSKRNYSEATIKGSGRSKEYNEEVISIINSIDSANFVTPIVEIIKTELQPFFEDKMTYEECIKQAQTKVDLYFAE